MVFRVQSVPTAMPLDPPVGPSHGLAAMPLHVKRRLEATEACGKLYPFGVIINRNARASRHHHS